MPLQCPLTALAAFRLLLNAGQDPLRLFWVDWRHVPSDRLTRLFPPITASRGRTAYCVQVLPRNLQQHCIAATNTLLAKDKISRRTGRSISVIQVYFILPGTRHCRLYYCVSWATCSIQHRHKKWHLLSLPTTIIRGIPSASQLLAEMHMCIITRDVKIEKKIVQQTCGARSRN